MAKLKPHCTAFEVNVMFKFMDPNGNGIYPLSLSPLLIGDTLYPLIPLFVVDG